MIEVYRGVVEGINAKIIGDGKKVYGLLVSGRWINGFGSPSVKKGDTVEAQVEKNAKGFWDIKGEVVISKLSMPGASASGPADSRDLQIIRQSAFKQAVEYIKLNPSFANANDKIELDDVIGLAKKLEKYFITGDCKDAPKEMQVKEEMFSPQ